MRPVVARMAVVGCGLALASALVSSAAAERQTTSPNVYVNINVTLTDSKVTMSPRSAPRGSDARFIVRNIGKQAHLFTLGTTERGLGFQTGFSRVFKPKAHQVLLLYLDQRSVLQYYLGASAKSATPAMKGTFTVGAQCAECVPDD